MKKNLLIISVCALTFFFSSHAYSAEGPYVSGNIGFAMLSDSDVTDSTVPGKSIDVEYDTGLAFGAALGYDFGNTRLEGEISYQKNDFEKASLPRVDFDLSGEITSLSLLMNGYYDFVNNCAFTPYLSTGLGFAKIKVNDLNVHGLGLPDSNDDDTVFAYQVGAGVGYAVNEKVISVNYNTRLTTIKIPEM